MSWVPWLIQLKAVMSRIRNTNRFQIAGLAKIVLTVVRDWRRRALAPSHTSDSFTRARMSRLIRAGKMDNANR